MAAKIIIMPRLKYFNRGHQKLKKISPHNYMLRDVTTTHDFVEYIRGGFTLRNAADDIKYAYLLGDETLIKVLLRVIFGILQRATTQPASDRLHLCCKSLSIAAHPQMICAICGVICGRHKRPFRTYIKLSTAGPMNLDPAVLPRIDKHEDAIFISRMFRIYLRAEIPHELVKYLLLKCADN